MSSIHSESPSIFEKTLSFPSIPGSEPPDPSEVITRESHRFYMCEKVEKGRRAYTCQKTTFDDAVSKLFRSSDTTKFAHIQKGCPEWNDRAILSWKLRSWVRIQPSDS